MVDKTHCSVLLEECSGMKIGYFFGESIHIVKFGVFCSSHHSIYSVHLTKVLWNYYQKFAVGADVKTTFFRFVVITQWLVLNVYQWIAVFKTVVADYLFAL